MRLFYKVRSSSNTVLWVFVSAKDFPVLQPGRELVPPLHHAQMAFSPPSWQLAVLGLNLSKISLNENK